MPDDCQVRFHARQLVCRDARRLWLQELICLIQEAFPQVESGPVALQFKVQHLSAWLTEGRADVGWGLELRFNFDFRHESVSMSVVDYLMAPTAKTMYLLRSELDKTDNIRGFLCKARMLLDKRIEAGRSV